MKVTLCTKVLGEMHGKKGVTLSGICMDLLSQLTSLQVPGTTDTTAIQGCEGENEETRKGAKYDMILTVA